MRTWRSGILQAWENTVEHSSNILYLSRNSFQSSNVQSTLLLWMKNIEKKLTGELKTYNNDLQKISRSLKHWFYSRNLKITRNWISSAEQNSVFKLITGSKIKKCNIFYNSFSPCYWNDLKGILCLPQVLLEMHLLVRKNNDVWQRILVWSVYLFMYYPSDSLSTGFCLTFPR